MKKENKNTGSQLETANYNQTRKNLHRLLLQTKDELGLDDIEAVNYVTDLILRYKDFRGELLTIVENEVRNNMKDIRS